MAADQQPLFSFDENMDSSERYHDAVDDYGPPQTQQDLIQPFQVYGTSWQTIPGSEFMSDSAPFNFAAPMEQFEYGSAASNYAPSSYHSSTDTSHDWGGTRTGSVSTANTSTDSPIGEYTWIGSTTGDADVVQSGLSPHECPPVPQSFDFSPDLPPHVTSPADLFQSVRMQMQNDLKRTVANDSDNGPAKRHCVAADGAEDKVFPPSASGRTTRSKPDHNPSTDVTTVEPRRTSRTKLTDTVDGKAKAPPPSGGVKTNVPKSAQLRTASRKAKQQQQQALGEPDGKRRGTGDFGGGSPPGSGLSPEEEGGRAGGAPGGEDDDLTPDERRARHSHNLVEKQYRNRLNKQFEDLLAVLSNNNGSSALDLKPPTQGAAGKGPKRKNSLSSDAAGTKMKASAAAEDSTAPVDDRRLSKAEVLEMARRRILALEQQVVRQKTEYEQLATQFQSFTLAKEVKKEVGV